MSCLSFSDNLLQGNHTIFHKSVDNFEIIHKICLLSVWGAIPLNKINIFLTYKSGKIKGFLQTNLTELICFGNNLTRSICFGNRFVKLILI